MKAIEKRLSLNQENRIGTTSSSPYLGSPTFDEIPFHVEVGCNPMVGSYVVIVRDSDTIVHYGRISDGTEENSRADPAVLQRRQAYQVGQKDPRPDDRSPDVTRVMTAEVLGEIHLDDGNQPTIKDKTLLAQTGKAVYAIPAQFIPELLGTPSDPTDGFYVGKVESGNDEVNFVIPIEALARHLAVVGKTGVGKSHFVAVLIEEAHKHGIPVVAFDVLKDLIGTATDLGGRNYTAGVDFRIPYSIIGTSEFLKFIPNLTPQQSELVVLAYERIYAEALNTLDTDGQILIPLIRLTQEIGNVAQAFGQVDVGSRAAQRVAAAIRRSEILTDQTEDWLYKVADTTLLNVYVGHLSQNSRNLVVAGTARLLQILRRRNQVPPHLFVLDEAHLFLPAGADHTASTSVIREMIRTARHDGIGIVLVTQSPSSMDKQVLLTCNTRIVFALDKDDVKLVSGTMGDISDQMADRIPKMAKGTSIISSGADLIHHAAVVKIRERKTKGGAPTPNLAQEVKVWREQQKSR